MGLQVVNGALATCTFGSCSTRLKISPISLKGFFDISENMAGAITENVEISIPNGILKTHDHVGNLLSQATYVNGVLQGESLVFNSQGKIAQKLFYDGGVLHGEALIYSEDGQLAHSLNFHRGLLSGMVHVFAPNGGITAEIPYNNGVMEGNARFFNPIGQPLLETTFLAGKENGFRMTYDADSGKMLHKELFVDGVLEGQIPLMEPQEGASDLTEELDVQFNIEEGGGFACSQPIATIMNYNSFVNIRPFCFCSSLANPAVAAATALAGGVLTPQPCTPNTQTPWIPGSPTVSFNKNPVLNDSSKLICAYAGVISIEHAGQEKVVVP